MITFIQNGITECNAVHLEFFRLVNSELPPSVLFIDHERIEYPALLALMPNAGPGDLHIVGQLDHFELPGRGSRDERLERWRAAGGRFSVTQASFASAMLRVEAEGPLGLDESHRLEGKLALKIRGAEALLQRFGLSAKMLNVGSTLGALLGGKPKPAGDEAGDGNLGKSLSLPLTLRDGKVSAGPFPLPVELLPLY